MGPTALAPTRTASGNCATTPGPPQIAGSAGSGCGSGPALNPGPISSGTSRNGLTCSASAASWSSGAADIDGGAVTRGAAAVAAGGAAVADATVACPPTWLLQPATASTAATPATPATARQRIDRDGDRRWRRAAGGGAGTV